MNKENKHNKNGDFKSSYYKEYMVTYSNDPNATFGTHPDTLELCKTITGRLIHLTPGFEVVFESEDGLYIIPYWSIVFMEPIAGNDFE